MDKEDFTNYFLWADSGSWIRISARAIIFNPARDRILVEHNLHYRYHNFIGGGVEVGETFVECLNREIQEETNARVTSASFLFTVENFFELDDRSLHSIEQFFELTLDREDVSPIENPVAFVWLPLAQLQTFDLRPYAVRDVLALGNEQSIYHLVERKRR